MSVREIVVGKEKFTSAHILVFSDEELRAIFGETGIRLRELAAHVGVKLDDIVAEIELCPGSTLPLGPGVTLVHGVPLSLEGGLIVPPLLDEEFLEYLLFDVPRSLDGLRQAVVVEELDDRFTRDPEDGVRYALDILGRISRVYRVPVIVTGRESLAGYGFDRRIIRPRGSGAVYVDGEPFCVYEER